MKERRKKKEADQEEENKKKKKKSGTPKRKPDKVEKPDEDQEQRDLMKKMMKSWNERKTVDKNLTVEGIVDDVFDDKVDEDPKVVDEGTRPGFKAALKLFSNASIDNSSSYETWKAGRQSQMCRKRKNEEQEDEMTEQCSSTAGRKKSLRLTLSSSKKSINVQSNTNNFTCSSTKGVRGDDERAGEAVQEGVQGLHGGEKEVTREKLTGQRAGRVGKSKFSRK